ncbi:hypothetical protein ABPG74_019242 [Tetrahymena malaccensis]
MNRQLLVSKLIDSENIKQECLSQNENTVQNTHELASCIKQVDYNSSRILGQTQQGDSQLKKMLIIEEQQENASLKYQHLKMGTNKYENLQKTIQCEVNLKNSQKQDLEIQKNLQFNNQKQANQLQNQQSNSGQMDKEFELNGRSFLNIDCAFNQLPQIDSLHPQTVEEKEDQESQLDKIKNQEHEEIKMLDKQQNIHFSQSMENENQIDLLNLIKDEEKFQLNILQNSSNKQLESILVIDNDQQLDSQEQQQNKGVAEQVSPTKGEIQIDNLLEEVENKDIITEQIIKENIEQEKIKKINIKQLKPLSQDLQNENENKQFEMVINEKQDKCLSKLFDFLNQINKNDEVEKEEEIQYKPKTIEQNQSVLSQLVNINQEQFLDQTNNKSIYQIQNLFDCITQQSPISQQIVKTTDKKQNQDIIMEIDEEATINKNQKEVKKRLLIYLEKNNNKFQKQEIQMKKTTKKINKSFSRKYIFIEFYKDQELICNIDISVDFSENDEQFDQDFLFFKQEDSSLNSEKKQEGEDALQQQQLTQNQNFNDVNSNSLKFLQNNIQSNALDIQNQVQLVSKEFTEVKQFQEENQNIQIKCLDQDSQQQKQLTDIQDIYQIECILPKFQNISIQSQTEAQICKEKQVDDETTEINYKSYYGISQECFYECIDELQKKGIIVCKFIKSGCISSVFIGLDTLNQRDVAIKLSYIWSQNEYSEQTEQIFEDMKYEKNIIDQIKSYKYVVNTFDLFITQKYHIIIQIMEYCETDLQSYIQYRKSWNNPLNKEEIIDIYFQLINALVEIHANGIVHLDIKPLNILRTNEGIYKLTDFGISQLLRQDDNQCTEEFKGFSIRYCSPEQYQLWYKQESQNYQNFNQNLHSEQKFKQVSQSSDVFSMGLTFLYILQLELSDKTADQIRNGKYEFDSQLNDDTKIQFLTFIRHYMLCYEPINRCTALQLNLGVFYSKHGNDLTFNNNLNVRETFYKGHHQNFTQSLSQLGQRQIKINEELTINKNNKQQKKIIETQQYEQNKKEISKQQQIYLIKNVQNKQINEKKQDITLQNDNLDKPFIQDQQTQLQLANQGFSEVNNQNKNVEIQQQQQQLMYQQEMYQIGSTNLFNIQSDFIKQYSEVQQNEEIQINQELTEINEINEDLRKYFKEECQIPKESFQKCLSELYQKDYRINCFLSQGGDGAVFKGFHTINKTEVAIKFGFPIKDNSSEQNNQVLKDMESERVIIDQIKCYQYVVKTLHLFNIQNMIIQIMEVCEMDLLKYIKKKKSALQIEEIKDIYFQLTNALVEIHANGIVHLDIKPENILRSKEGMYKLTDFGISQLLIQDKNQQTSELKGLTVKYSSPEQYYFFYKDDPEMNEKIISYFGLNAEQIFQTVSQASDVFSMGLTSFKRNSQFNQIRKI